MDSRIQELANFCWKFIKTNTNFDETNLYQKESPSSLKSILKHDPKFLKKKNNNDEYVPNELEFNNLIIDFDKLNFVKFCYSGSHSDSGVNNFHFFDFITNNVECELDVKNIGKVKINCRLRIYVEYTHYDDDFYYKSFDALQGYEFVDNYYNNILITEDDEVIILSPGNSTKSAR